MISLIPKNAQLNFAISAKVLHPNSVDTHCPHCFRKVNYSLQWPLGFNHIGLFGTGNCPGCQEKSIFIYPLSLNKEKGHYDGELFIHPANNIRQPLNGIERNEIMSDELKTAYNSTIDVFNAQVWPATAVLCRRVLEGITKTSLPADQVNKPLFQQLQQLPNHIDLQQPILTLADALRIGGNFGAHFVMGKEPNQEVSKLMIDLLDYLIEYIYILPTRIQGLHDKLENLNSAAVTIQGE